MNAQTNLTVLGTASLSRSLPLVGGVLIALFVFVKPEATAGLGFVHRLTFWTLHIGLGLAGILAASALLARITGPGRSLIASVLTTDRKSVV